MNDMEPERDDTPKKEPARIRAGRLRRSSPRRKRDRLVPRRVKLAAFLITAVAAASATIWAFDQYAPPQHNPMRPLSITHPIGAATYFKIMDLQDEAEQCFDVLDEGGIQYTRLEDTEAGKNCGYFDAATLNRSMVPYSATISMTCPMMSALAIWERQIAGPLSIEILGSPVSRIETYGTYSCRRMNGTVSGRWSEHATANAIDIMGFRLADGRLITLDKHWGTDTPEGEYLRRVRNRSCRIFSVVLGPDYNAAHKDHFHFDLGGGDVCR